ncbi:hydroxymethylpyrimidine/phosphomethylpyrimidine kinase [Pedobacter metabolipauper]|uniref:hydroxymethylpyrimidine kinase n=1 Tax=Pedobacter metabolipauper TaxID=425513 RepID=A0A4R6SY55_9SPHI|nr:hydroxymethylpyrimidine/phosphomethylpyrimidine kinase [Pedobacter metabolipauper]TDQ11336.1 hydroxymethylpyrimidine/phosphomethylpyrimidine kinase [Pedobacter metabolipauper]
MLERPYTLSIAGFDPSAGAGILADIKCFEQHQVYGFGICSALTVQNDVDFIANDWLDAHAIINQITPLLTRFTIRSCKIGLIKDQNVLLEVITYLRSKLPLLKIIVDPILKASAGYNFYNLQRGLSQFIPVLDQIDLITPNYDELLVLSGSGDAEVAAITWAQYCPVLLKGGHNPDAPGTDLLFDQQIKTVFKPGVRKVYQKHGSGCVLSASITANIALGYSLPESCERAKKYMEHFLNSNNTLLGYHSYD